MPSKKEYSVIRKDAEAEARSCMGVLGESVCRVPPGGEEMQQSGREGEM